MLSDQARALIRHTFQSMAVQTTFDMALKRFPVNQFPDLIRMLLSRMLKLDKRKTVAESSTVLLRLGNGLGN